jgi:hypothetical protein
VEIEEKCNKYAEEFVKTQRSYNKSLDSQAKAKFAEFIIYNNYKYQYPDMIHPNIDINTYDSGVDLGNNYSVKLCINNKSKFLINKITEKNNLLFLLSYINNNYYLNEIILCKDIIHLFKEPPKDIYVSPNKKEYRCNK